LIPFWSPLEYVSHNRRSTEMLFKKAIEDNIKKPMHEMFMWVAVALVFALAAIAIAIGK
jgi:hypothetical protein